MRRRARPSNSPPHLMCIMRACTVRRVRVSMFSASRMRMQVCIYLGGRLVLPVSLKIWRTHSMSLPLRWCSRRSVHMILLLWPDAYVCTSPCHGSCTSLGKPSRLSPWSCQAGWRTPQSVTAIPEKRLFLSLETDADLLRLFTMAEYAFCRPLVTSGGGGAF